MRTLIALLLIFTSGWNTGLSTWQGGILKAGNPLYSFTISIFLLAVAAYLLWEDHRPRSMR